MVDFEKLDDDFFNREWDGSEASLAKHVGGAKPIRWTPSLRVTACLMYAGLAFWVAANGLMLCDLCRCPRPW